MTVKITLNQATIKNLQPGKYADTTQRGLLLTITPTAARFSVYAWLHGKPFKKALGRWPALSVSAARVAAGALLSAPAPKPEDKMPTLQELTDLYSKRCQIKKNKTDYMPVVMERYWSHLLDRRIDKVEQGELEDHHNEIALTRGEQAARRAISTLRILYSYAINKRGLLIRNVARGVDVCPAAERDVYLTEPEIVVLRECLDEMAPDPRAFFLLALLTGMRCGNILGLQREWINLEEALITVPASASKNKRVMEIPLVPEAVEILKGRMALPGGIFEVRGSSHRWMAELRLRLRARGVTKHIRTHDLRRSFASRLVAAGSPLPVVSAALGHKSLTAVKVYARTSTNDVREWMAKVY